MISRAASVLRFDSLAGEPSLRHGVSTRPFNVSFTVGSHYGDAAAGRRAFMSAVGIDPSRTVVAGQVHGAHVSRVNSSHAGAGALVRGTALPSTDGLITTESNVGLFITGADCPSILLLDSRARVLGLVHSGWRGTAANIVRAAVESMLDSGASRDHLRAAIGPGIGACCYEVGDDVADRVPSHAKSLVLKRSGERWRLDLGSWISLQLSEVGIRSDRLERSPLCTGCRVDLLFSHRVERGRCGRFGVVAALV